MAVEDSDSFVDEVRIERLQVGSHGFLICHVGAGGGDVQAGKQRERSRAVVHQGGDVEGLSQLRGAAGFADAADPRVQAWEELMWQFQQPLPWAKDGEKWVLMDKIFEL